MKNTKDITILVVDDMAPMIGLISSILKALGYGTIFSAQNGQEAFASFCEHNQDLIIADWNMTPINGLELTNLIRKSDQSPNQQAPIVMITSHSEKELVLKARDNGINEYIIKPFTADGLQKKIKTALENPRQFVTSSNFTGPDRRRRKDDNSKAITKRRQTDSPTSIIKTLQKELKTDEKGE